MKIDTLWYDNWDKFIIHNINKNWNFQILSKNPNLNFNIVMLHPNINWDFDELSLHPEIIWDFVKTFSHKNWTWHKLSKHPNLSFDFVKNNKDFNWDWWMLSHHPNLRYNIVEELKEKPWNMTFVNNNHYINIPIGIRMDYYNIHSNFGFINDNPYFNDKDFYMGFVNNSNSKDNINSIICDVVLKVKRKYNFTDLSRNNFLTSEILVLYIDKNWDFDLLSYNDMQMGKDKWISK